jgi:hypothetical protein
MTAKTRKGNFWDWFKAGYPPLTIKDIQNHYTSELQAQARRVNKGRVVQQRNFGGGGFHYNVFSNKYELERGDSEVSKGILIDFDGTSLEVAPIDGKIYALYAKWHSSNSGGLISESQFEIDVESPDTVIQRLQEIPDLGDLLQRTGKAQKYGMLTAQEIPEPKLQRIDPEHEAWCKEMFRKGILREGSMLNQECTDDYQARIKQCENLLPTLEHIITHYLKVK